MQKSNFNNKLHETMRNNQHLTPTLNDVYDTFNDLNLRIDRNEEHTEMIFNKFKFLQARKVALLLHSKILVLLDDKRDKS